MSGGSTLSDLATRHVLIPVRAADAGRILAEDEIEARRFMRDREISGPGTRESVGHGQASTEAYKLLVAISSGHCA